MSLTLPASFKLHARNLKVAFCVINTAEDVKIKWFAPNELKICTPPSPQQRDLMMYVSMQIVCTLKFNNFAYQQQAKWHSVETCAITQRCISSAALAGPQQTQLIRTFIWRCELRLLETLQLHHKSTEHGVRQIVLEKKHRIMNDGKYWIICETFIRKLELLIWTQEGHFKVSQIHTFLCWDSDRLRPLWRLSPLNDLYNER